MSEKLSAASNIFCLSLYKKLVEKDRERNLIYSPFSLSAALGMLYFGVKGKSAEEMQRAMGYNAAKLSNEEIHQSFKHCLDNLSRIPKEYELQIANSVLVQNKFPIRPEYVAGLGQFYDAEPKNVDFKNETEKVKSEINSWVSQKTKGRIENLLEFIDESTVVLLLNAVYFKGQWQTQFDTRETHPIDFYNHGKKSLKKSVPMMNFRSETFPYADLSKKGFLVLELPYRGNLFSMWVILPKKMDGLSKVESQLSVDVLSLIKSSLVETKLNAISIPKFKLEDSKELPKVLQEMGMVGIFNRGELTGIADNLVVTQVVHKAFLEVNEAGSEAAASTAILIAPGCSQFTEIVEFVADHPFMFLIINKADGMIMFSGRVNEL